MDREGSGKYCPVRLQYEGGERMPTYEYTCNACKKKFTAIMSLSEHGTKKVTCPKCKSRRVVPRFTSVYTKTSRKS